MNLERAICSAFCEGFHVREVPIGYSIRTPLDWLSQEPLVFFAEVSGGAIRFTDSGDTLLQLEDEAGDLRSESRIRAISELAASHKVQFDEEGASFYSDWIAEDKAGPGAITFLSFMNRLQDLALLSRERVAGTFREDLIDALRSEFGDRLEVSERESLTDDHPDYIADAVISGGQRSAAIYAATSDLKVLEALLAAEEIRKTPGANVIPFAVFEDMLNSKIGMKTRRRALNSNVLHIADWRGGRDEVIEKISQTVGIAG